MPEPMPVVGSCPSASRTETTNGGSNAAPAVSVGACAEMSEGTSRNQLCLGSKRTGAVAQQQQPGSNIAVMHARI